MLKKRYQVLLIAFLVLAVYYPANFSEYSRIDDPHIVEVYQSPRLHLKDIIKSYTKSQYYRPIPAISYFIDKRSFNLDPGLMHSENILFHLLNAILVFFLTRTLLSKDEKDFSYLPLLTATLFGLHPINTESVNWISGRTDLIAGIFILSTTLLLLKFRSTLDRTYLFLSGIGLILAMFTKEVAFGFLPGVVLILNARNVDSPDGTERLQRQMNRFFAFVAAAVVLFIMVRYFKTGLVPGPIRASLAAVKADPIHGMFILLRSFGFYLKKLVIPYPLNIFIQEVDPLYQLIAIPLVMMSVYIAARRTILSAVFTAGVLMILPALIIVFNSMAWTAYAERYLYIPSAFVIVSGTVFLHDATKDRNVNLKRWVLAVIIVLMAATTLHRSILWQDEKALFEDTIAKSRLVDEMRMLYGSLLRDSGDYDKAVQQFTILTSRPAAIRDVRADLMIADIRFRQQRYDDSLAISEAVLARTDGRSTDAMNWSIGVLWAKLPSAKSEQEKRAINLKLRDYHTSLLTKYDDPHILYALGVISRNLGSRREAIKYYQLASARMKMDDPLRKISLRKAEKLAHPSHEKAH